MGKYGMDITSGKVDPILQGHSEEHVTNVTNRYTALVGELDSVCFFQWLLYFKYDKNFSYPVVYWWFLSINIDKKVAKFRKFACFKLNLNFGGLQFKNYKDSRKYFAWWMKDFTVHLAKAHLKKTHTH